MTTKYSDVIAEAVMAAVSVFKEPTPVSRELAEGQDAKFWFAMYQAQCAATDEFHDKLDSMSESVHLARIKELETQNAELNKRLANANDDNTRLRERMSGPGSYP